VEWFFNNLKVIQSMLTVLFFCAVWALAVTFSKKKDHANLANRVKEIELTYSKQEHHTSLVQRVNTVEVKVKGLPSSQTIHSLEKEVGELKGSVDGMKDLLSNINNHVNMLVENEIKGS